MIAFFTSNQRYKMYFVGDFCQGLVSAYHVTDSVTHKSPPLTLRHNPGRFSCPMVVRRIKVMLSWSRYFTYHRGTAQKSVAGVVPPIRAYSDILCVTHYLINSNREAKGVIFVMILKQDNVPENIVRRGSYSVCKKSGRI